MPRQVKNSPKSKPKKKVTERRPRSPRQRTATLQQQNQDVTQPAAILQQDQTVAQPAAILQQDQTVTQPAATLPQQKEFLASSQTSIFRNYEVWRGELEKTIDLNEVCRHLNVTMETLFDFARGQASLNPIEDPSNISTVPETTLQEDKQAEKIPIQPDRNDEVPGKQELKRVESEEISAKENSSYLTQNSGDRLSEGDSLETEWKPCSPDVERAPSRNNSFMMRTPTRSPSLVLLDQTKYLNSLIESNVELMTERRSLAYAFPFNLFGYFTNFLLYVYDILYDLYYFL